MTKIYGIYGVTQAKIQVPFGNRNTYLMIEFVNGNPHFGMHYRPATYVCANKTEQDMIESSPLYGHKIILYRTYGVDKPEPQPQAPAAAPKPAAAPAPKENVETAPTQNADVAETTSYPDVTNIDEARVALKAAGAKATQLASEEAMKKFMEKKHIVFPNFNF